MTKKKQPKKKSTKKSPDQTATVVADLGYGDGGKGTMTDYLAALSSPTGEGAVVVRHSGGGQAAHGVTAPDGRRHVFSQFGAGSFLPDARTVLSRHMLVSPLAMLVEAETLHGRGVPDIMSRTLISEEARLVTPFQRAAGRLREMSRGDGRHGSCGMGVGETAWDSVDHKLETVRVCHLDLPDLVPRLRRLQELKRAQLADVIAASRDNPAARDEINWLENPEAPEAFAKSMAVFRHAARVAPETLIQSTLRACPNLVFEGAQGVLIDEWRGFHPYTTWSTCTFDNALELLRECGWAGATTRLGVIRAYGTRHGAGPFPSFDPALTAALPDSDNVTHDWQGAFRVGWLDLVTLRYAVAACGGLDTLAITCLDRLEKVPEWRLCVSHGTLNGVVFNLPLGAFRDLRHQETLTRGLERSSAITEVTATPDQGPIAKTTAHVRAILDALPMKPRGVILSHGATRKDKTRLY